MSTWPRVYLAAGSLLAGVLLVGCGDGGSSGAAGGDPRECLVPPGETETQLVAEELEDPDNLSEGTGEQLELRIPADWCVAGDIPPTTVDDAALAGVRIAGPPDQGEVYSIVEVTGMWNREQSVALDSLAVSMSDALDGDWTEWTDVAADGLSARIRANTDPNARSERQIILALDDWLVSARSHDLDEAGLIQIIGGLSTTTS